jgi:peroxiredoxin
VAHVGTHSAIGPDGVVTSPRRHNGDRFRDLLITVVDGCTITLQADLAGSDVAVLFYRGSWCPYCNAQLATFSRARELLAATDIAVVALSVDDEATSRALVDELRIGFPAGYGVKAADTAAAIGTYVAEGSSYLRSTGFVLDRDGRILVAVCSSGAIGRLLPTMLGSVRYVEAQSKARPAPAVLLTTMAGQTAVSDASLRREVQQVDRFRRGRRA